MNKTEKNTAVEELKSSIGQAKNAFVIGFSGITVPDVTELRKQVRGTRSSYVVVKNTLALRAIEGGALEPLGKEFTGPTAVAWNADNPVGLAKALTTFAKTNAAIRFKGAVVEGRAIPAGQIQAIAELPTREELVGRLLFMLQSPVRRLVTVMNGPMRNLASVLAQIREKKEKSAPAAEAAPGA
jgi:large subunit ribosomal protein L10